MLLASHLAMAQVYVPLEPGRFNVRVCPGRDWECGHAECGGENAHGTVIVPTVQHCMEWLLMGLTGECGGRFKASAGIHDGGWWLTRSDVVRWDNGHEAFYMANDEGAYDLYEIVPQENNHNSDHNDHNRKRKFEEALQADILQKSAQRGAIYNAMHAIHNLREMPFDQRPIKDGKKWSKKVAYVDARLTLDLFEQHNLR